MRRQIILLSILSSSRAVCLQELSHVNRLQGTGCASEAIPAVPMEGGHGNLLNTIFFGDPPLYFFLWCLWGVLIVHFYISNTPQIIWCLVLGKANTCKSNNSFLQRFLQLNWKFIHLVYVMPVGIHVRELPWTDVWECALSTHCSFPHSVCCWLPAAAGRSWQAPGWRSLQAGSTPQCQL